MITIPRRAMLRGLASLPLSAQLLALNGPVSAETAFEAVSVQTSSGRTLSGVAAVPTTVPAPGVLLIHGSSGLVEMYKSFAMKLAQEGFFALALDLYDGRTAADDATRSALMSEANSNPAQATETVATWIEWLKANPRNNGKVGVVGWSFGAGWALEGSMAMPVDATVVYVGLIYPGATRLALLKGPVLVHLAERDDFGRGHLKMFESMMKEASKSVEAYWYAGDHFFPFPNRPTYNKALADAAWARTVEFLRANLQ